MFLLDSFGTVAGLLGFALAGPLAPLPALVFGLYKALVRPGLSLNEKLPAEFYLADALLSALWARPLKEGENALVELGSCWTALLTLVSMMTISIQEYGNLCLMLLKGLERRICFLFARGSAGF